MKDQLGEIESDFRIPPKGQNMPLLTRSLLRNYNPIGLQKCALLTGGRCSETD